MSNPTRITIDSSVSDPKKDLSKVPVFVYPNGLVSYFDSLSYNEVKEFYTYCMNALNKYPSFSIGCAQFSAVLGALEDTYPLLIAKFEDEAA